MDNLDVEGNIVQVYGMTFKTKVALSCFRIGRKTCLGGTQSGPLEG